MPKVAQDLITQSHWDNMSKSRSKSKDKSTYNLNNNFNDEGSNTLYKSKPQDSRSIDKSSVDRDDDKKSSLTRKSSSKSLRGGKKQILGMNTFK